MNVSWLLLNVHLHMTFMKSASTFKSDNLFHLMELQFYISKRELSKQDSESDSPAGILLSIKLAIVSFIWLSVRLSEHKMRRTVMSLFHQKGMLRSSMISGDKHTHFLLERAGIGIIRSTAWTGNRTEAFWFVVPQNTAYQN